MNLKLHYDVPGDDFTRAGEASGAVKRKLKQLGFPSDLVRRVAIAMYEGEINMVIHAGGGEADVEILPDRVVAVLTDHGPGIPDSELPHVKEKFFKGEKHKARGSGIGLAVCDEIVTRSGGTLTIGNAPGGGTLVSVRLPFAAESST